MQSPPKRKTKVRPAHPKEQKPKSSLEEIETEVTGDFVASNSPTKPMQKATKCITTEVQIGSGAQNLTVAIFSSIEPVVRDLLWHSISWRRAARNIGIKLCLQVLRDSSAAALTHDEILSAAVQKAS